MGKIMRWLLVVTVLVFGIINSKAAATAEVNMTRQTVQDLWYGPFPAMHTLRKSETTWETGGGRSDRYHFVLFDDGTRMAEHVNQEINAQNGFGNILLRNYDVDGPNGHDWSIETNTVTYATPPLTNVWEVSNFTLTGSTVHEFSKTGQFLAPSDCVGQTSYSRQVDSIVTLSIKNASSANRRYKVKIPIAVYKNSACYDGAYILADRVAMKLRVQTVTSDFFNFGAEYAPTFAFSGKPIQTDGDYSGWIETYVSENQPAELVLQIINASDFNGRTFSLSWEVNGQIVVTDMGDDLAGVYLPGNDQYQVGQRNWGVNTAWLSVFMSTLTNVNSGAIGLHLSKESWVTAPNAISYDIDGVPKWEQGMDFLNHDFVVAYTHDTRAPFGTGDMFRFSPNRKWILGPAQGSPTNNVATGTMEFIPSDTTGLHLKNWNNNPGAKDALRLERPNNDGDQWIHFTQGNGSRDFRIGMYETNGVYKLGIFQRQGTSGSPTNPGVMVFNIEANGFTGVGANSPTHRLSVDNGGIRIGPNGGQVSVILDRDPATGGLLISKYDHITLATTQLAKIDGSGVLTTTGAAYSGSLSAGSFTTPGSVTAGGVSSSGNVAASGTISGATSIATTYYIGGQTASDIQLTRSGGVMYVKTGNGATDGGINASHYTGPGSVNVLGGITGSRLQNYVSSGASITLNQSSNGTYVLTSNNQTVTLPSAVGIEGQIRTIKLNGASVTAGTVSTSSSQTIDGALNYSLSGAWKFVTVQAYNNNWIIISKN